MRAGEREWSPDRDEWSLGILLAWGLLLVVAAAVRFRALEPSLFEDEVWVANLIRHGDWHPHSYSTPPLFYALLRGWSRMRGFSDTALREPVAALGVALCALPLAAPRPMITRLLWGVLLACSSPLLFYSTRIKQYTLEAFVATLLIILFLHWKRSGSTVAAAGFFVVAATGVTTLFCTVFLLPAFALFCLRKPRMLAGLALLLALFGWAYFGWLAPGAESARLHGDMTAYFAANGRWVTSPASFLAGTMHWSGQLMNLVRFWWLVVPLLVIGWIARTRSADVLVLALIPPLLVAGASAFHLYPYGEVRLMIFCFPALALLVAEALDSAAQRVPILLLLIAPFVFQGLARDPYNDTYMKTYDLRPLYDFVAANRRPGEAIYATPTLAAPLRYYHPELGRVIEWQPNALPRAAGWYLAPQRALPSGSPRLELRGTAVAREP